MAQKDLDRAQADIDQAIKLNPGIPLACYNRSLEEAAAALKQVDGTL